LTANGGKVEVGLSKAPVPRLQGGNFGTGLGERLFESYDPGRIFGSVSIAADAFRARRLSAPVSPPQETADRAQASDGGTEYGEDRLDGVHSGRLSIMPTSVTSYSRYLDSGGLGLGAPRRRMI
jgi:hypothetical protein